MSTHLSSQSADVTRIIVVGASGRMGSRICQLAHEDDRITLVGALSRAAGGPPARAAAAETMKGPAPKITASAAVFGVSCADVVIDFSSDAGTRSALELAQRIGAALLVGTTALTPSTHQMLRERAQRCAVLLAPNTSLGVAALSALVRNAAALLQDFDCSIVESHHIHKKDAPSGTALRLADAAQKGGAVVPDQRIVSQRGGDVVGEHTVRFAGSGEYVELTHRATSRDLFVRGALRAAQWLRGREAGWWTMEDVLGLGPR